MPLSSRCPSTISVSPSTSRHGSTSCSASRALHRVERAPLRGGPPSSSWRGAGGYGPGTPRHGWDHGTAWYRRVLEDIWKLDVQVIECELTLADVTPAMEGLRPQAAENLATAHSHAQDNAMQLARRLAA